MKRISLYPLLLLILSGCDSDNPVTNDPRTSAPTETVTLAESVKQSLEVSYSNHAPQLDRTESLEGTDGDGNGVRDDIDLIISGTDVDETVKQALTQHAKSLQNEMKVDWDSLSEEESKAAMRQLSSDSISSKRCLMETLGSGFSKVTRTLKALTYNTKARTMHYLKGNNVANGMAFSVGGHDNACDLR
ncbi:hypothetical protein LRP49_11990 [Enterovibrio sp. ZSDZ35]|uniref:Lipoprotein n=1 Tax=Enterovibrio qingdaonensis TaxID=2899818 RepID=A0ABT5QLM6_9GAMM|nr:hypothetical protein [Enterovibrio sp. ZSDZ35]MDD1781896.1 hypothetical protein [Enterovibrio sp. ZSDZ35]